MYADLTKADILQKCLHGLTQTPNEGFNSTIWERAPKTVYCGLDTFELAVHDAVANYNYGRKATIDILKHLNTRFSFYKNILYRNIEDEMGQKVKNILRICSF